MAEKGETKKLKINYKNPEEIDKFIDKYQWFIVYSWIQVLLIICIVFPICIILSSKFSSSPMIWIIIVFTLLPFIYMGILINKGLRVEDTIMDVLKYEYKTKKSILSITTRKKIPKGILMKFKRKYT